jgi:hypothetical protein
MPYIVSGNALKKKKRWIAEGRDNSNLAARQSHAKPANKNRPHFLQGGQFFIWAP